MTHEIQIKPGDRVRCTLVYPDAVGVVLKIRKQRSTGKRFAILDYGHGMLPVQFKVENLELEEESEATK